MLGASICGSFQAMSESTSSLKHTALYDKHAALGAKFAEFGGWEMPIEYSTGVLKEHAAVRESVGLFDVSHLGKVVVRGDQAYEYLNRTFTNDLAKIEPGRGQYTLLCDDETGGVVDDLIVYFKDDEHLLLVPNAANSAEVIRRLSASAPEGLSITDHHESHAVLAIQGTKSDEVLDAIGLPTGHGYMSFVEGPYGGVDVLVCRTGYTGERGYELIIDNSVAPQIWDALLKAGSEYGILPCGLGARDTLRTEMGYPLHGQDLGMNISPVQAGIGWAVGWKKSSFSGRDALVAEKEAGPTVLLRGLVAKGRGIPRPHMGVRLTRDLPIGEVTSGTFSPTLRKGIGLALINAQIQEGAEVSVDIRGRQEIFEVTKPPFVSNDTKES